ncbi:hypothetical protein BVC80_9095g57 [Macleaya cordata]|uniref:Uncharacterized protein n=1 Tax=Macleaya cordata TaxID=56857 RepID=A0A200PX96_MACCD|nr:hypothetical protein BVC80_9095g57 [Macleaya cordata]
MKIQRSSLDVSVQMGRWWRIRRSFGGAVLSILLVVVLAQQVQHSSAASTSESHGKQQLMRWNHPKRELVDKVNKNGGPYVGIVMAYSTEEIALQSSGLFVPNSQFPTVDLSETVGGESPGRFS